MIVKADIELNIEQNIALIADLVSGIGCCAYIILPFIQYISMFNQKQYVNVVGGVCVHLNRPPFTIFFLFLSAVLFISDVVYALFKFFESRSG